MELKFKKKPNLDEIATMLYMLPIKAKFYNQVTTSDAAHDALGKAYKKIEKLKDDILDKLIGYTGERPKMLALKPISNYTESLNQELAKEIMDLGKVIDDIGDENDYCDLERLGYEYNGVGAKLAYKLTQK